MRINLSLLFLQLENTGSVDSNRSAYCFVSPKRGYFARAAPPLSPPLQEKILHTPRFPRVAHLTSFNLKYCTVSWPLHVVYEKACRTEFDPLKWKCHEIFGTFSPWIKPTWGPLINRLKWFCWKIRFRGDIWEISDSVRTNTAQSKIFRT